MLLSLLVIITSAVALFALIHNSNSASPELTEHAPSDQPENLEQIQIRFVVEELPAEVEWKLRTNYTSKSYCHVNLQSVTCTCEEFVLRRTKFETQDIRRLCGHLIRAYRESGAWVEPEEIVAAMFATGPSAGGCWTYDLIVRGKLSSGEPIYFGLRHERDWMDVYARKRRNGDIPGKYTGSFGKFGFNRAHQKWSFGTAPPGAREIRGIIGAL